MSKFSHFNSDGNPHMVNVGEKPVTPRKAVAKALIEMEVETLTLIQDKAMTKGDVLEVARLAGIMGSKKTSELIPLCHPISITSVELEFRIPDNQSIEVTSTVCASDRTGVEMEALTSVTTAALTIYDMCKSVDRAMTIREIKLTHKSGGKSGTFDRVENESKGDLERKS